jgi:hypothetical protein
MKLEDMNATQLWDTIDQLLDVAGFYNTNLRLFRVRSEETKKQGDWAVQIAYDLSEEGAKDGTTVQGPSPEEALRGMARAAVAHLRRDHDRTSTLLSSIGELNTQR